MATATHSEHLAEILSPIEAVLLDRAQYGWEDDFYEQVIDPMTPWLPDGDEKGETPLSQFTDQVREQAKRAALEATVASITDSLAEAPESLVNADVIGEPARRFRNDAALARAGTSDQ